MVGSSGSRLEPSISQVRHVKIQALITDHLLSKIWGEIYSDHLEYDLPQDKGDESETITFPQYLANITENQENMPVINYSTQHPTKMIPQQYNLCNSLIIR